MNKDNILKKYRAIKMKPLLLDGAVGSLCQARGYKLDKNLWASLLNIESPDLIKAIHKEYIEAGADIITTNTFRTNPIAKRKSILSITNQQLVNKSVALIRESNLANKKIIIAGSNAPAEDCYQDKRTISKFDLEYNHKKHIELLIEAGVDLIWNETQSHFDEIQIICEFCAQNTIPFSINLFCTEDLKILSGEEIDKVINSIRAYHSLSIGINCVKIDTYNKLLCSIPTLEIDGYYLNCGLDNIGNGTINNCISPEMYINKIKHFLNDKTIFVGSCCGSSPKHTKAINEYLDEVY